jgi:hypothetical protein
MKSSKLFALLFLLITASSSFAQTEDDRDSIIHSLSIDSLMCEFKISTVRLSYGLSFMEILDEADRRLNNIYSELMKRKETNITILKTAQRNWIKYRDAEFQFIESQTENQEGTMYPRIRMKQKIRIVSQRVDELEWYNTFLLTIE